MKLKNLLLLNIVLLLILSNQDITAQTTGLIFENSHTPLLTPLDPNGDGYVSQDTLGFSLNDLEESEISYTPIPVLEIEPDSDPVFGPFCAYNDIVNSGSDVPVSFFYDGANLFFRFRLGGTALNAKGYTIMVDSDEKFGFYGSEADPNAVVGNPGFEFEIVLETEYGVGLYNVDGLDVAVVAVVKGDAVANRPYIDYAQKSIALTTSCGDPDYFYDFYVPMADLIAAFPLLSLDEDKPLRFVGATVMNHTAFIGSSLASDIAGTDENYFGDIFDCIPPIAATGIGSDNTDCRTSCPLIDVVSHGADSVSGTSTEPDLTVIKVYKDGTFLGETTVSSGVWVLKNIDPVLASGDTITATAKDGTKYVSFDDCDI